MSPDKINSTECSAAEQWPLYSSPLLNSQTGIKLPAQADLQVPAYCTPEGAAHSAAQEYGHPAGTQGSAVHCGTGKKKKKEEERHR